MNQIFDDYLALHRLKVQKHLDDWLDGLFELLLTIPADSQTSASIKTAIESTLHAQEKKEY